MVQCERCCLPWSNPVRFQFSRRSAGSRITSFRLAHGNSKSPYDSRVRHHAAVPAFNVREISQVNLMPLMAPYPTQQGKIRDRERPSEIGVV